jgi:integrase
MTVRKPSYRYHKARDCAVVTIDGHDHYLGEYDSPQSWEKYHRLVAEWMAGQNNPPPQVIPAETPLTVTELVARYWKFVKGYYVKDGKPTSEADTVRQALRFVRRLYGSTPAREFSPKKLKAVRQAMIDHKVVRHRKACDPETGRVLLDPLTQEPVWEEYVLRHGLARRFINKQVGRVKRLFAWAVEEELVGVEVHAALLRVKGLKKGKSDAREKKRVRPVPEEHLAAVLPLLPPTVRVMAEVQKLCGCRPQDIVGMRADGIDRSGQVWEYRPLRYKTEHYNDQNDPDLERTIYIGPTAQRLLRPFIEAESTGYLFSPARSEETRNARKKEGRKTPRWPSHVKAQEQEKARRKRASVRDHYDVASYRRAIRRACEKGGVPIWHPNQLRHSRLTEIRKRFGLEASRVCGGHREVAATQVYAEQDRDLARQVMAEIG